VRATPGKAGRRWTRAAAGTSQTLQKIRVLHLTSTFYEASAVEEEDWRRRRGRGNSAKDGAVDVRWPLSPSRMRPAGLLQPRHSEERN
jgi:hypothetical protein